jgi:hypothetical protein
MKHITMKHMITILIGLAALGLVLVLTPRSTSVQDSISGASPGALSASLGTGGKSPDKRKGAAATASISYDASKKTTTPESEAMTFSDFRVSVKPKEDEVNIKGSFTLGAGSNGINLFQEPTSIKVGAFSATIPAGKFKSGNKGKVEFKKLIDCVYWDLFIRPTGKDAFEFNLEVQGTKGTAGLKAEDIAVSIGDDAGTAKPTP